MKPHEPVIAEGGRRCDFPVSADERCNLLEEEHPATVFIATGDSPHWSFLAAGETPEEAEAAYRRLLRAHTQQTGADPDWLELMLSDIQVQTVVLGAGYRDDDMLTEPD